jgi:hypothetical protein
MNAERRSAVIALYCACWAGIVIGVSFIATIAKFNAPSLTRAVALDVGAHTFAMLCRIEWGLFALLALMIVVAGAGRLRMILVVSLLAILLVDSFWLFPQLHARTTLVIAGQPLPPSPLHAVSVAAQSAKVLLLAFFAIAEVRRRGSGA